MSQTKLTLEQLKELNITNPIDGQALVYDAALGVWKNATLSGSLTEEQVAAIAKHQALLFG